MEASKDWGYLFGCPYNTKDFSILKSILGSPYLRKLPYNTLDIIASALSFFPFPTNNQEAKGKSNRP